MYEYDIVDSDPSFPSSVHAIAVKHVQSFDAIRFTSIRLDHPWKKL